MLNGDTTLTAILGLMRQAIYTPIRGLPDGMSSLADLGVSTGSASSTISRDALAGKLELDDDEARRQLASDPSGVRDLLAGPANAGGWARAFERIVHGADTTGGTIDVRITGADGELKRLAASMADMDQRLALQGAGAAAPSSPRWSPRSRRARRRAAGSRASWPRSSTTDALNPRSAGPITRSDAPNPYPNPDPGRAMSSMNFAASPQAYRESAVLTAPPERLVVMLYDGARRFSSRPRPRCATATCRARTSGCAAPRRSWSTCSRRST